MRARWSLPLLSLPLLTLALLALATGGCSDDTIPPKKDRGPSTDSTLFSCPTAGLACNAHDSCAINPVCGQDLLCHPERLMSCDDGLECTVDSCGLSGQCLNTPRDGTCALLVKDPAKPSEMRCLKAGDTNPLSPCQACDPKESKTKWSPASGSPCDDGIACTKNDVCVAGACQGTSFASKCGDGLECTQDVCDGKGGCTNPLKAGWCLIGAQCFPDQGTDPTGCKLCDAKKDPKGWSQLGAVCAIGGLCHKPGDKDVTGCGVCDPVKNAAGWSAATGMCFIDKACLQPGAADATGCGSCDPAKSTTSWSVAAGKCLIGVACVASGAKSAAGCGVCEPSKSASEWSLASGATSQLTSFDSGLGGFTLGAPVSGVGWQLSTKRARAGAGSLYYGNPATGSYDSGTGPNSGSATSAPLVLPAGQKAAARFWLWLDVEPSPAHDVLSLRVGSTVLWKKDAQTPTASYRGWLPVEVSLTAYAGQTVQLVFVFDTIDGWANGGEGVYLDELEVVTGCGS